MRPETLITERVDHRDAQRTLAAAVVASNEVVRRGLAGLLGSIPEFGSVRVLTQTSDLPSLRQAASLDVVIVAAADTGWLADARDLVADLGASILVVVDPPSVGSLDRHASRLANGFLWQQNLNPASLWAAVRRCRSGEVPVPPELTRALISRADQTVRRARPGSVNLTRRERETLSLLVKGLSNKQIAKRLSISCHGAKRLVTSIMLKLDTPNRTLAAVTAIRAGLVDDDR